MTHVFVWGMHIGAIFGSSMIGYYTDKVNARKIIVPILMFFGAYNYCLLGMLRGNQVLELAASMILEGLFLGGPYMILSAVIASDVGKKQTLKNKRRAISTIAGLIEGFGSLCFALSIILLPLWELDLFIFFSGRNPVLSTLLISKGWRLLAA